jgi:hypothetical protein
MDAFTVAAICTLILKGEAAVTAVPPGTNCAYIVAQARASAARASTRVHHDEDREAIARVAFAEAANQGDRGIAAVVFTIINRLGDGRWGRGVSEVLNSPKQFEPVMRVGGDWRNLKPVPDDRRPRIDAIVSLALRGDLADETGGALYFQNPAIVAQRERAGLVSRGLTHFGGQRPSAIIGDHAFYTGGGSPKSRPTLIASANSEPEIDGESERQRAYINAGGSIFGEGMADAFDSPPLNDVGTDAVAYSPQQAVPTQEGERESFEQSVPSSPASGRERIEPRGLGNESGMFVLPSGQTSSGPPSF